VGKLDLSSPMGQLQNELAAEEVLAMMDLQEDLADLHDTETCDKLREKFAGMYQEFIGVLPDQRQEFREALETVLSGSQIPVSDLVEEFQSVAR
jgi:hypothetical protein